MLSTFDLRSILVSEIAKPPSEISLTQCVIFFFIYCFVDIFFFIIFISLSYTENLNLFLNLALKAETSIKPKLLLKFIKGIESQLGRTPSKVYMDRTIDIDIIFYGLEIINLKDLIIPHPSAHHRRFVLEPLMEIDKDLIFPGSNSKIVDLLSEVKIQKIQKIKNFNIENI